MRAPIIASYVLLIVLTLLSVVQGNWEFLIYAAVLLPVVVLIHWSDRFFTYTPLALWGFASWMLLHIVGGLVPINGEMTYNFILIDLIGAPYNILKYDQVVHFYCYVVMALLLGSVVTTVLKRDANRITAGVILVLAATGVGAINEIVEFVPVILFDSPGPGGYTNTAIDIVANFLGAIVGSVVYFRSASRSK